MLHNNFMTINDKMRNLTVFSQFHTLYIKLLDLIKKASIATNTSNIITPQEALCLIQLFEYQSTKHSGDSGLKSLAKRTNNVADHLLFQLNNLARRGLVAMSMNEITITDTGEQLLFNISEVLSQETLLSINQHLNQLQKILK